MIKYHYVYRITNTKLNKHYYGSRTSSIEPTKDLGHKYLSSSHDKEFIKDQKINPQDYKYKIVSIFNSRKEALELEVKLHAKFNVGVNNNFYNKARATSSKFTMEGTKVSEETRLKHLGENNGMYGKNHTIESRIKMSQSSKNPSEVTRKKMSKNHTDVSGDKNPMYGKKHTIEAKIKMSKPKTEEHRRKMSEAAKKRYSK
jgi:hypothetical protein